MKFIFHLNKVYYVILYILLFLIIPFKGDYFNIKIKILKNNMKKKLKNIFL